MSNPNLDALRELAEKCCEFEAADAPYNEWDDAREQLSMTCDPDTVRALVALVEQQHAVIKMGHGTGAARDCLGCQALRAFEAFGTEQGTAE